MGREMVRVQLNTLMEKNRKVSGKMVRGMVRVQLNTLMENNGKVSGKMVRN